MIHRTTAMWRNGYGDVSQYISTYRCFSDALRAFGWVQTNDTGQVQFDSVVATITGTSLTSNVAKYYTASTTGLRVGQSIVVAGLTLEGTVYNITGIITSISSNAYFTIAKINADIAYADDTGTGTVSAVSAYPSTSPYYYYEIWRMNDSLQETAPVFLKFGYGGNSANNGSPQLALWIGTGSNGSGSLVNAVEIVAPYGTSGYLSGTTALSDCLFSGDSSRFQCLAWRNGYCPTIITVERSKDVSGNDTDEGVFIFGSSYVNATNTFATKYVYRTKNLSVFSDTVPPTLMASFSSSLRNGSISIYPLFCLVGGVSYPMRGAFSCKVSDFVELDEVSLSVFNGVNNNYVFSSYAATKATAKSFGYSTNNGILMRYD